MYKMCSCVVNQTILSNGCLDQFPNNTLSNFKISFPFSKELRNRKSEKWYISLNSIGVSNNFKNRISQNPIIFQLFHNRNITFDIFKSGNVKLQATSTLDKATNCFEDNIEVENIESTISQNAQSFSVVIDNWFRNYLGYLRTLKGYRTLDDNTVKERSFVTDHEVSKKLKYFKAVYHYSKKNHYESLSSFLKESLSNITHLNITELSEDIFTLTSDISQIFFLKRNIASMCDLKQTIDSSQINNTLFEDSVNLQMDEISHLNRSVVSINNEYYEIFIFNKYFSKLTITIKKDYLIYKNEGYPEVIKLKCADIRSQITNGTHSQDLAILKLNLNKNKSHLYYEFENPIFIPLLNSTLNQLHFELSDQFDNLLQFDFGIPTCLEISVKKMDSSYKSFNVYLSNFNNPNINASNFNTCLPKVLKFSKQWYCGLQDITFSNTFKTFPNNETEKIIIFETTDLGVNKTSIIVENLNYDAHSLVKHINDKLTIQTKLAFFVLDEQLIIESSNFNYRIAITKALACVLGLISVPEYYSNISNVIVNIEQDTRVSATHKMNLNQFIPNYLMIYTDLIKNSIINEKYTNLLRVVPIEQNITTSYQTVDFKNITYHEISNYLIDAIKIEIRDHSGQLIQFQNNDVNLHLCFTNTPNI